MFALSLEIDLKWYLYFSGRGNNLAAIGPPEDIKPSLIPIAIYRALYAYSGW